MIVDRDLPERPVDPPADVEYDAWLDEQANDGCPRCERTAADGPCVYCGDSRDADDA